jgi:hypothetical protein
MVWWIRRGCKRDEAKKYKGIMRLGFEVDGVLSELRDAYESA